MGRGCEQSINGGVERAPGLGKIVQGDDYCGEHRATRPVLACVYYKEAKNKSLLHIPSSRKLGTNRGSVGVNFCPITLQGPLSSRIRQSIRGAHATSTVYPSFLAAIAAAGFLHCSEQLPVT
jgi:hypothetical protein